MNINYKLLRNITIFTVFVLVIGWIGVAVDNILPEQEEEETLGMAIWLITPLILVFILRTFMGDGWKDAGLKPNFQGNLKWYVVALLIFPIVTLITLVSGISLGWVHYQDFDTQTYLKIFVGLFFVNIVKNIFEESVWRGYLTAKLIQLKLTDWQIYLSAGLIWGFWHAPYYLHFLPEASLQVVLPVDKFTFLLVAVLSMIGWTVMFTEIFRLTGSIWPVILLHAGEDALINHLIIDEYITITSGKEWLVSPICGLVPFFLYLVIGLWMRHRRVHFQEGVF